MVMISLGRGAALEADDGGAMASRSLSVVLAYNLPDRNACLVACFGATPIF